MSKLKSMNSGRLSDYIVKSQLQHHINCISSLLGCSDNACMVALVMMLHSFVFFKPAVDRLSRNWRGTTMRLPCQEALVVIYMLRKTCNWDVLMGTPQLCDLWPADSVERCAISRRIAYCILLSGYSIVTFFSAASGSVISLKWYVKRMDHTAL